MLKCVCFLSTKTPGEKVIHVCYRCVSFKNNEKEASKLVLWNPTTRARVLLKEAYNIFGSAVPTMVESPRFLFFLGEKEGLKFSVTGREGQPWFGTRERFFKPLDGQKSH